MTVEEIARQLYGPAGAFALVLLAMVLLYREDWLPGKWHRREIARMQAEIDKAEARADREAARAQRAEMIALKASGASEVAIDIVRQRIPEAVSGQRGE